MNRFQYCVLTKASRQAVWALYLDWQRWPAYADILGEMKWTRGEPWKIGSELEIELLRPFRATVQHSITLFQTLREVAWVDRALGITISQWVSFEDRARGGTQIYTEGDISPTGAVIKGTSVDRLVRAFTETWFENFCMACDKLAQVSC
jgi:hypothetical protein